MFGSKTILMNQQQTTSKQYFQTLRTMHLILIFGVLVFGGMSLFFMGHANPGTVSLDLVNVYYIILATIGIAGVGGSEFLSRKRLIDAKNQLYLKAKLQDYTVSKIIKYGLLEAPAILGIVFHLLTAKPGFIFISMLILMVMAVNFPSKEKTINELDLSVMEQKTLNDPDAIISDI